MLKSAFVFWFSCTTLLLQAGSYTSPVFSPEPATGNPTGWGGALTNTGIPGDYSFFDFLVDYIGIGGPRTARANANLEVPATPPCPTITFTATPTKTCPGNNNGQIAVTGVSGGVGPYMYSKDNGANYQSGATFTGLAAGVYWVMVKDANECVSGTASDTVYTFSAPSCAVTGPDFVCDNTENIVYSAPGGMSAYNWDISGNGSIPGSTTGSSVSVTSGNFAYNYTVYLTVTDANGCTSSCSRISNIFLLKPPADITANPTTACLGATIDLSVAAAASSTVAWSGEGVTNPGGNPSTTAVPTTSGPHTYTVTVTADLSGCVNTGTASVTINPLPTLQCPPDFSVCVDGPPVSLEGSMPGGALIGGTFSGDGVSGVPGDHVITPGDAGVGQHLINYDYTDPSTGCSANCNFTVTVNDLPAVTCPSNITVCNDAASFALTGGSPGGGNYTGYGVNNGMFDPSQAGNGPHTITYGYTDGNGCTGYCTFTVTVETCNNNVEFSGKIIWEDDDVSGVKDATVNLTGSASGSDVTDVNGDFSITTGVSSGNFTLKPVKNINKFNGVNAGDVTAIQQHVAHSNLITDPYKQVCADVNKSNSITTLDASILLQALLGNPAANNLFNTSWRFVPTSYVMSVPPWGFPEQRTYTGISGSQTDQDFYGMKIGDVTGNANPANFDALPALVLHANDISLESGAEITMDFSADQFDDLAAFQMALQFDTEKLQLVDIQPREALPLEAGNFGLFNIEEGEIRVVWSEVEGVNVEEASPVFTLKFNVLQGGGKLSDALLLDESVLPGQAYNSALAESKVELKTGAVTSTGDVTGISGFQLLQNLPNPFSGATTIGFVLPETCETQLRIFDTQGRLLRAYSGCYPAGKNAVNFNFDESVASGLLFYELTTPFGVLSRKMVVNR